MGEVIVRRVEEIEPVPCPCGESRRLVTRSDGTPASLHVTHILNGSAHYHKETTEFYYVLSGSGAVELDGEETDVRPGTAVVIPPGVTHKGLGDFETVVVSIPAFDAADEFLVGGTRR